MRNQIHLSCHHCSQGDLRLSIKWCQSHYFLHQQLFDKALALSF